MSLRRALVGITDRMRDRLACVFVCCCGCGATTVRYMVMDDAVHETFCGDCAPFETQPPIDWFEFDPELDRVRWADFEALVEQIERAR